MSFQSAIDWKTTHILTPTARFSQTQSASNILSQSIYSYLRTMTSELVSGMKLRTIGPPLRSMIFS